MPPKRLRHDGPPVSGDGYRHSWAAFQGKAYPNQYNGSLEDDQDRLDRERDRKIKEREERLAREKLKVERHLRKRRREKTGR